MRIVSLLLALGLAACAATPSRAPIAAAPVPTALPAPRPPAGAVATMVLPQRLADGRFATPNQQIAPDAKLWHVRVGLNVAALACRDPVLEAGYNKWLRDERRGLADAHRALEREFRARYGSDWQPRFDAAMTQLYNYFAQPPVAGDFCATASALLPAVAARNSEPAAALDALDAPFQRFYGRYADYQQQVAAWRQGSLRLAVDAAALTAGDTVTAGTTLR